MRKIISFTHATLDDYIDDFLLASTSDPRLVINCPGSWEPISSRPASGAEFSTIVDGHLRSRSPERTSFTRPDHYGCNSCSGVQPLAPHHKGQTWVSPGGHVDFT